MLCLITDMKFDKENKVNEKAGEDVIRYLKERINELPVILQSSEQQNESRARALNATFINKNSQNLTEDFKYFITNFLGFGDFIYKNEDGTVLATARTLKEFEIMLKIIPDDSLILHTKRNHFSMWLMARGEIQVAKIINPAKVTDFETPQQIRDYIHDIIEKFRNVQNKGKVVPYEESAITDDSNIVSISQGGLGGKGRGLAFINSLIYNYDFQSVLPEINVKTPKTAIIGSDEFENFIEYNHLREVIFNENYDEYKIKEIFVNSKLNHTTVERLAMYISLITKPIAVRSSGLFEDSLMQPFAGIFDTYLLPNNHPDENVRLEQVVVAIKLVYASVFAKKSRSYIEAINYKIEEERMSVILQEVVGNTYDNYYYPHISGVAQSYNYYPFAHMKPDEGFAVVAVGLGTYVVEGEKAYRFSPLYPNLEINSPKDQLNNSQLHFFAINMDNSDLNLLEGEDAGLISLEIDVAEKHGTLNHSASVYDKDNESISPGLSKAGPRIINFADIFKYNYIPLAETIEVVLAIGKEAMGSPVEIEFAVDLTKDENRKATFYLLQIKPLLGATEEYNIKQEEINREDILLMTDTGMGNGIINDIYDVIYIDREKFDKRRTLEMANEIEKLNEEMKRLNRKYILIGPGRWGTRDRWIGIPVAWPQISFAKIIVETSFDDFPIEASSGSHFFHNVTSMNVGYFTVQQEFSGNMIAWDVLDRQKIINRTEYFKHIAFENPLTIRMDGKKRISLISWEES